MGQSCDFQDGRQGLNHTEEKILAREFSLTVCRCLLALDSHFSGRNDFWDIGMEKKEIRGNCFTVRMIEFFG